MSGMVEVLALSVAVVALGTWAVVVAVTPRLGAGQRSPSGRLATTRAWLFAPLWVPAVVVLAAALPGIAGAVSSVFDHCAAHVVGHRHQLCVAHPPSPSGQLMGWLLPLLVATAGLGAMARGLWRARRGHRLSVGLARFGHPCALGDDVRLLEQPEPLALAIGWRRPVVLLSRGLVDGVDGQTLAVVLAHERAHIARGDVRWAVVERVAAALLPRATAGRLLDRLTLAREQVCDMQAAERVGSRLAVARALTRVARLSPSPAGVSIAAGSLEARVALLLDPPESGVARLPWVVAGLMIAGLGPLHVVVEDVVTALLHLTPH